MKVKNYNLFFCYSTVKWGSAQEVIANRLEVVSIATGKSQQTQKNLPIEICPNCNSRDRWLTSKQRTVFMNESMQPYLSIRVEIKDVETFFLKQKKIKSDETARWSFDQKFRFCKSEYELRKSFVDIYFEDDEERVVGQISVNLYLVSTGPYHQDFAVKMKKGDNFRASFDLKISQVIQINIDSIEAEVKLTTKHPGEKFNYSIKTIIGYNTPLNVSSSSYSVQVMIDDKDQYQLSSHDQIPDNSRRITLKNKHPIKYIKPNHNLVWTKQDLLQMPSVFMKILVSELHHSYFQILIWKINDKSTTAQGNEVPELYGECYIALHKLFDKDPDREFIEGKHIEKRVIEGSEKIWHHGRAFGMGSFKFSVENEKYIKQMQVMVQTEEGISKHSPVFSKNGKNKKSGCREIDSIIKIGEQIQSNVEQLDKIQNTNMNPNFESRKLKVNIERLLENLVVLLEKSDKQSLIFFYYSSQQELYRAQETFIALGFKIISYLEEEDALINELCWQILIALIRRGEFLLAHIGFDQAERENIKKKNIDRRLEARLEIAVTYFELLRKLLELALNSLNIKGVDYERCFAEMFCAYSYFRIPNFRSQILSIIVHANDPEISEWRGIEFSLQDDINYGELQKEVNAFTILCDWDHHYHKCLESNDRYGSALSEIQQLMSGEAWKLRLSKRGIAFFYFVKYWIEYIESIVVKTKDVQWKYFPGYNKLVKCFLVEMKKRPILEYPDALKIACFNLLSNDKLLNPICVIIFNKANIYEPLTVIKAIEFLNEIFTVICRNGRKIPPIFNYAFFYQGIKIILESDFSFAISKTIIMLYTHFKIFSLEFRRNLSMLLLGKLFFPLFLHWSNNVRDIFYHLLVMRVYRESLHIEHDSNEPCTFHEKVNEEIRSRYAKLQVILNNVENLRKEEKRQNFIHSYEKELFKKLKKKMYDKKRAIRKMTSSDLNDKEEEEERVPVLEPSSPASEKIDKSTLYGEKYSTSTLGKNTMVERSHSELLKPSFKMTYHATRKDPEVRRMKTDRPETYNLEIYDATTGKKEKKTFSMESMSMSHYKEQDFEIEESIEPSLIEYIMPAIKQFQEIKKELEKHINEKSWEIPKIKIEMPLDSKEIRPDQIDDW